MNNTVARGATYQSTPTTGASNLYYTYSQTKTPISTNIVSTSVLSLNANSFDSNKLTSTLSAGYSITSYSIAVASSVSKPVIPTSIIANLTVSTSTPTALNYAVPTSASSKSTPMVSTTSSIMLTPSTTLSTTSYSIAVASSVSKPVIPTSIIANLTVSTSTPTALNYAVPTSASSKSTPVVSTTSSLSLRTPISSSSVVISNSGFIASLPLSSKTISTTNSELPLSTSGTVRTTSSSTSNLGQPTSNSFIDIPSQVDAISSSNTLISRNSLGSNTTSIWTGLAGTSTILPSKTPSIVVSTHSLQMNTKNESSSTTAMITASCSPSAISSKNNITSTFSGSSNTSIVGTGNSTSAKSSVSNIVLGSILGPVCLAIVIGFVLVIRRHRKAILRTSIMDLLQNTPRQADSEPVVLQDMVLLNACISLISVVFGQDTSLLNHPAGLLGQCQLNRLGAIPANTATVLKLSQTTPLDLTLAPSYSTPILNLFGYTSNASYTTQSSATLDGLIRYASRQSYQQTIMYLITGNSKYADNAIAQYGMGNWHSTMTEGLMNYYFLKNNSTGLQFVVQYYQRMVSGSNLFPPIYSTNGEECEVCRDIEHANYGTGSLVQIAESFWHQGVDLYSYGPPGYSGLPGLAQVLETTAYIILNNNWPPNVNSIDLGWGNCTTFSKNSFTPGGFHIGYNHYVNRMGLSMPNTQALIAANPDTAYYFNWGLGVLTHTGTGTCDSNLGNPTFPTISSVPSSTSSTLAGGISFNNTSTKSKFSTTTMIAGIVGSIVIVAIGAIVLVMRKRHRIQSAANSTQSPQNSQVVLITK
ncbi:hypothetical protein HDV06_004653 [Boothiomyces sp. JEL0866]|nr:hypothetical protein HDV06_004653 [Boothiomyces sp. JEL0866]